MMHHLMDFLNPCRLSMEVYQYLPTANNIFLTVILNLVSYI